MRSTYMTAKEVREFLWLSPAAYYRLVHPRLLADPAAQTLNGRLRFKRRRLLRRVAWILAQSDQFRACPARAQKHFGRGQKRKPRRCGPGDAPRWVRRPRK